MPYRPYSCVKRPQADSWCQPHEPYYGDTWFCHSHYGNPRLYLGVADLVSGVSGFIDPNSVLFAPYDKNRPVGDYLVDVAAGLTTTQALAQIHSGSSANILTKSAGVLPATGTVANAATVAASSSACGTVNMANVLTTATGTFTISVVNTTAGTLAPSVNFLIIN